MKVAIIVQDMCGQGVQYATAMAARMFVARGWAVDLLVSQVHVDCVRLGQKAFEVPQSVKWIYMPSRRARGNALWLRRYLRRVCVDLVLIEGMLYNKSIVLATFGISKQKLPKLAMVTHGNTDSVAGGLLRRTSIYLKHWALYRKLSSLMVVNQKSAINMRSRCKWLPKLTIACVNNACCDEIFWEKIAKEPTHPWLINKICFTVVAAGAYEPYKDHMTLLRAVKIIKGKGRMMRVIIFGRGSLLGKYKEYIRENELEDMVSIGSYTLQLPAEIKASDGFVLSSNWESFGIVLAEGLACQVPCVATDAPYGPGEILNYGKYGRLVPICDPEAMARALVDLMDGKIAIAPDESWQRYTIDVVGQKYFAAMGVAC